MPRLSKKEQERKKILSTVQMNKNKFDYRTYNAVIKKINNFERIDFLKKYAKSIELVINSNEKKLTLVKIKKLIDNKKLIDKKKNIIKVKRDFKDIVKIIEKLDDKDLLLVGSANRQLYINANHLIENKKSELWYTFFYDANDNDGLEQNEFIYITENIKLNSNYIRQLYKQGTTNCVFKPIIEWCDDKINESKTKSTCDRYKYKKNICEKLEKEYRQNGVADDDLKIIADKLQINLKLTKPFQNEFTIYRSNKKPLTTFDLVNVKLDHVELNKIVNNKPIKLEFDEMQNLYNNLIKSKTYFIYKKGLQGCCRSINTIDSKYILKNDYDEFINNFEEKTGIVNCKLCSINDYELTKYVSSGCHFNMTALFKQNYNVKEVKLIDQKKAYCNVDKCTFYRGYLGKITDMRRTNKIVDIGLYTINNIKLVGKMKELNDKMNIYKNNCTYPSPELEFLQSLGCTFDIIYGCWGSHLDFKMDYENETMWNEKHEDIRNYCRYIGTLASKNNSTSMYMKCDENFAQAMQGDNYTYNYLTNECKVEYKKQFNHHATHISGFVCSYLRINTLEQLMTMNINDIIRVVCDGIYHVNNYDCVNIFRKEENKKIPDDYFNNEYIKPQETIINDTIFREHHLTELHNGPGGCGKTHTQLLDKGLQKVCYFAPSWKLSSNKKNEYNCKSKVWYNLYTDDYSEYKKILKRYNTLIIDEVSMMDNNIKNLILERFKTCKLIFCGDVGYQLPTTNGIKFEIKGFDKIIEYENNYRVEKGDKLLDHLKVIRTKIKNGENIRDYIINNFTKIDKIENYIVNDMILTYTNLSKDKWTEKYKHLEKYYVTHRCDGYNKGDIIYDNIGSSCELRHGYTVHSIQGETAHHNLYIDMDKMYINELLYTSVSRAKRFNQIFLLF